MSLRCCLLIALLLFAPGPHLSAQGRVPQRPVSGQKENSTAEELLADATRWRAEWRAASFQKAVEKYRQASLKWRATGDRLKEAQALKEAGDIYCIISMYQNAIDSYNESLRLYRAQGDHLQEAELLNCLGYVYDCSGDYQKSSDYGRQALAAGERIGSRRVKAHALNNLAEASYFSGAFDEALDYLRRALSLCEEEGDKQGEARAKHILAWIHIDQGETDKAFASLNQALALWRATNDRQGEAATLSIMGSLFTMLGEYQNALDFQNRALSIFQEIGDRKGEADVHGRAGYIYFCVGELNKALNHYTRSTAVYRESHNRYLEGTMLANIGDVLSALGNDRDALEKYKAALPLIRSVGDKQWEALTQNSMASAYFNLGESRQALDAFNQALPLFEAVRNQRWEANTLNGIGVVYRQSGEWQKALEHHQKALHLSRAAGDRAGEALTLYDIAYAERARGNLDAARSNIESAIRISETLRTNVASHDMRASFLASTHQQYSLYIDVLMRSHNQQPSAGFDSRAFEASERGRARSLLETLAESHANIRQGVDAELIGRERGLQRQLKAGAERRIQLAEEKASSEELATVERELGDLTMEYQQVQGQIRASSPRYAALMQPAPLALGEIQRKVLDADTVLLEYALGEERSFVWAVTPDSIKSFELPARAEVEKAARRVYELLTARNRRPTVETPQQWLAGVRRAEAEYPEASAALGRMLLGPVAAELGRKRLVIVADGALQYVSFAALPAPDTGAAKPEEAAAARGADFIPLIMEHEVVTLPSASVLALTREEMRERRPAPKAVAVLADPVFDGEDERLTSSKSGRARKRSEEVAAASDTTAPGIAQRALRSFDGLDKGGGIARLIFSQREARAIMASVPAAEGMLALGFRASRATATSPELSQYRIVHFATHGLLNSENPELSGVILSRFDEAGRPQEGFLASYEIYNLNLPAELVVLSACQTALGKDVRGEGLVGLTRGFMYAGARRVVASLWKVDDSATAELMGEFYREMLVKGSRPADALRAAQLHMWRQQRWRSPYFWAAFTLQGEWR